MPDTYFDLFLAYSAVWSVIALYMLYLARRLNKINAKLKEYNKKSNS